MNRVLCRNETRLLTQGQCKAVAEMRREYARSSNPIAAGKRDMAPTRDGVLQDCRVGNSQSSVVLAGFSWGLDEHAEAFCTLIRVAHQHSTHQGPASSPAARVHDVLRRNRLF